MEDRRVVETIPTGSPIHLLQSAMSCRRSDGRDGDLLAAVRFGRGYFDRLSLCYF